MSLTSEQFVVRPARRSDASHIYEMICELASYEKMRDQVELDAQQLEEDGFGPGHEPRFRALVAELDNNHNHLNQQEPVGFLLYVQKYSTFKGPFLWIEDLFVRPEHRRKGLGQALIQRLTREAQQRQMPRIEWNVLGWNQLARDFYRHKIGAYDLTHEEDWLTYRLTRGRFEPLLEIRLSNIRFE